MAEIIEMIVEINQEAFTVIAYFFYVVNLVLAFGCGSRVTKTFNKTIQKYEIQCYKETVEKMDLEYIDGISRNFAEFLGKVSFGESTRATLSSGQLQFTLKLRCCMPKIRSAIISK